MQTDDMPGFHQTEPARHPSHLSGKGPGWLYGLTNADLPSGTWAESGEISGGRHSMNNQPVACCRLAARADHYRQSQMHADLVDGAAGHQRTAANNFVSCRHKVDSKVYVGQSRAELPRPGSKPSHFTFPKWCAGCHRCRRTLSLLRNQNGPRGIRWVMVMVHRGPQSRAGTNPPATGQARLR